MTTIREVVETPGMPTWVRFALALMTVVFLRMGALIAQPMFHSGWMWGHGLAALVAIVVGIDLLHSALRKRWPLLLFVDLLVVRLATGRGREG